MNKTLGQIAALGVADGLGMLESLCAHQHQWRQLHEDEQQQQRIQLQVQTDRCSQRLQQGLNTKTAVPILEASLACGHWPLACTALRWIVSDDGNNAQAIIRQHKRNVMCLIRSIEALIGQAVFKLAAAIA
jgi:hypothetical protein